MFLLRRTVSLAFAAFLVLAGAAQAADLQVVSSGGGLAALRAVAPELERRTGIRLVLQFGPSMGNTQDTIPQRLSRGEDVDAVVMVGYALDKLAADGKLIDPVNVALSKIGAAVRQGAPAPDISTVDGLRQAMLTARTIAVSDSASGVYIRNQLLNKLGIADQVGGKIRMIPADPVGGVVAKGDADLGFQQISELKPVPGITVLGPIPDAVQDVTTYKAAVVAASKQKEAARTFLRFLASPDAAAAIRSSGLEPNGP